MRRVRHSDALRHCVRSPSHKLVKFRTTAMVVRGAVESFKPPINADVHRFHRR